MTDLATLATAAGCLDLDALQFVNFTLGTPAAQIADLRARKPHFFKPNVRDMTQAEWQAARVDAVKRQPSPIREIAGGRDVREMSDREYARAKADAGLSGGKNWWRR